MARHPDWFAHLDAVLLALEQAPGPGALGRPEIEALFGTSPRDSLRLLHRFGARPEADALSLPRPALLAQLERVRASEAYRAFLRKREGVAQQLQAARAESAARRFRVRPASPDQGRARLADLPGTVTWRRAGGEGPGRFEILYDDGADLLWQLAAFLQAAGVNREEFLAGTELSGDRQL